MRPTKLQTGTVGKLEEAFKLGCTVGEACSYAEISRSTYYLWIEENPEFSDKIVIARKYLAFKSRFVIAKSLEAGDVKTAMWYLERKNKEEFSLTHSEIGEVDNTPQKFIMIHKRGKYADYDDHGNPPPQK